jgi:four helix bundle protein
MPDYRKLRAWQLGFDLAIQSRPFIKRLPAAERYALADQWRRSAYSVPLNIAEGASRKGAAEFRRHLDIARGSLHELETIFDLVIGQEYFRPEELATLREIRDECSRTVWGLIRSVGRRLS